MDLEKYLSENRGSLGESSDGAIEILSLLQDLKEENMHINVHKIYKLSNTLNKMYLLKYRERFP
jgi:hypothetical protein